jgi:hypothetical protein
LLDKLMSLAGADVPRAVESAVAGIGALNSHLQRITENTAAVAARLEMVDARLDMIDTRLAALETAMQSLALRLVGLHAALSADIDKRSPSHERIALIPE